MNSTDQKLDSYACSPQTVSSIQQYAQGVNDKSLSCFVSPFNSNSHKYKDHSAEHNFSEASNQGSTVKIHKALQKKRKKDRLSQSEASKLFALDESADNINRNVSNTHLGSSSNHDQGCFGMDYETQKEDPQEEASKPKKKIKNNVFGQVFHDNEEENKNNSQKPTGQTVNLDYFFRGLENPPSTIHPCADTSKANSQEKSSSLTKDFGQLSQESIGNPSILLKSKDDALPSKYQIQGLINIYGSLQNINSGPSKSVSSKKLNTESPELKMHVENQQGGPLTSGLDFNHSVNLLNQSNNTMDRLLPNNILLEPNSQGINIIIHNKSNPKTKNKRESRSRASKDKSANNMNKIGSNDRLSSQSNNFQNAFGIRREILQGEEPILEEPCRRKKKVVNEILAPSNEEQESKTVFQGESLDPISQVVHFIQNQQNHQHMQVYSSSQARWSSIALDLEQLKILSSASENKSLQEILTNLFVSLRLDSDEGKHKTGTPDKIYNMSLEGYKVIQIIGNGAHGLVLKVRDETGEVKVVKLFPKNRQDVFLREVCAIAQMSVNSPPIIEANDFYGMVLEAGIGTLFDFKRFLQEKNKILSQKYLLCLFNNLYENYKEIIAVDYCHRDIKPDNIVLRSSDLSPDIIDFSLSLYLGPETYSGFAGTLGYIAPYILNQKQNLSKEDLISGDLFAMGISILELRFPSFNPQESNMNEIKNLLSKLKNKQKKLYEIIEVLVSDNKDKLKALKSLRKKYIKPLASGANYYDYRSMFKEFVDEFKEYLKYKFRSKSAPQELMREESKEGIQELSDPRLIADSHFEDGLWEFEKVFWSSSKIENEMSLAATYYHKIGSREKMLLCYENIAKGYLRQDDEEQAMEMLKKLDEMRGIQPLNVDYQKYAATYCQKILKELKEQPVACNPLLFSTVGVYFYRKAETKKARDMFLKGLTESPEEFSKLILLNNYACASLTQNKNNQECNQKFQELYNLVQENVSSKIFEFLESMDILPRYSPGHNFNFNWMVSTNVPPPFMFLTFEKERLSEIIIAIDRFVLGGNYDQDTNRMLIRVIFQNFCSYQGACLIALLKRNRKQNTLNQLEQFVKSFFLRVPVMRPRVLVAKRFQILMNMLRFKRIFQDSKEIDFANPPFNKLKYDLDVFDRKKKVIYTFIDQGKFESAYKELKQLNLFHTMVGIVTSLFRPFCTKYEIKDFINEQISAMSEVTTSVELRVENFRRQEDFLDILQIIQRVSNLDVRIDSILDLTVFGTLSAHIEEAGYKVVLDPLKGIEKQSWLINFVSLSVYEKNMANFGANFLRITNLKSLEHLSIRFSEASELTDHDYLSLKEGLMSLPLRKLELYFKVTTNFNDVQMKYLAEGISSLHSLEELIMSYCRVCRNSNFLRSLFLNYFHQT